MEKQKILIADDSEMNRALLAEILGDGEFWLRPPYGLFDSSVRKWADCPIILWSVDPEDWKDKDVDRIVAAVVEHVKDGDIILMHDIFDTSVDAALRVVDNLLSEGYCFVTVEQLMEERQVEPAEGRSKGWEALRRAMSSCIRWRISSGAPGVRAKVPATMTREVPVKALLR